MSAKTLEGSPPALYDNCQTCDVPYEILAIMPMRIKRGEAPGMGAFYQCPKCLLMRLHEAQCTPDEDYVTDEYREALGQPVDAEQYRAEHEHLAQQQASVLALRKGSNVIDVGCGPGLLLDVLLDGDPTLGTAAVEPNVAYQTVLYNQTRHSAFADVSSALATLGPSADYVLLMLVLEHVSDPWQILRDVKPLLAPGGEVCITVPGLHVDRAWADSAYRRAWFCAQHRWYFEFAALRLMLEACGYEVSGDPQYWNREDGWVYQHIRGKAA